MFFVGWMVGESGNKANSAKLELEHGNKRLVAIRSQPNCFDSVLYIVVVVVTVFRIYN